MTSFIGFASGLGAGQDGCKDGPAAIHEKLSHLIPSMEMVYPNSAITVKCDQFLHLNQKLAEISYRAAKEHPFTLVLGGDHSCAIGTWSGIAEANRAMNRDLGLIWVDAHMDCHTHDTTPSGNVHGMPLAALLGHGKENLAHILSDLPKLKPENVFLVGIRSYEEPERALLEKLNVRVYYMEEVKERGMKAVFEEILAVFKSKNLPYGLTVDVDFFDPEYMSATGTPVEGGADPKEFIEMYSIFDAIPPVAFELVEYNPHKDTDGRTLEFITGVIEHVMATHATPILV